MTKQIIISLMSLLLAAPVLAQIDSSVVTVTADPRIAWLAKKQSQINKLSGLKNSAGQWKGFRVMVANTNNRDTAYKKRADILRYFPDKAVYMAYQAPYFKLKAGDFVKREDAEKFRKELSKYLSGSLFVVPDIIKISAEEEARLLEEQENRK
jgi:hypothetical protein